MYLFIHSFICLSVPVAFHFRMKLKECLQNDWSLLTSLTYSENLNVAKETVALLNLLPLPSQDSLSNIFKACQNLTTAYIKFLHLILKNSENDGK